MSEYPKKGWFFFLHNWRFTYVLILAFLLIGLTSAALIPKESEPDVDIPVAVVTTVFPGASAIDVEELVTDKIEDKIIGLENAEIITSESSRGISSVIVEFDVNSDIDEDVADLKERVDLAKSELPEDADDPFVQKISFSDMPILTVAMSGPYPVPELKIFAERAADEIERLPGISGVSVVGGQERIINVNVNKAALDRYQLPLRQVTEAIRLSNSDIPIGGIETAGENFTLRFESGIASAEEIADLPITSRGGAPIYVKDVAEVEDGYTEETTISELSVDGSESLPSITLRIQKVSGKNVVRTVDSVWETIETFKQNELPEDVVFMTIEDNAAEIRTDLNNLLVSGLETVIIVMSLLFIFLGFRESLLAGLGIPLTFLITFGVLYQIGYTLNFLTLFSLILALGIIVDGAVVITEGMNREIKKGHLPKKAAYRAIKHFSMPLAAGTLTTVFAFLPMMLTSGIIGKFIKSIPVTVSIVLLASLAVALAVIPTVGSRWLKQNRQTFVSTKSFKLSRRDRLNNFMTDWYGGVLDIFLKSKTSRHLLVLVLFVMFAGSLALPASGLLKVEMFGQEDLPNIYINVENPIGTPIRKTDESIRDVIEYLRRDENVESFLVNAGSSISLHGFSSFSAGDGHLASIVVTLKDERKESSIDITGQYSRDLPFLTNARITAEQLGSGPGTVAPVELKISGSSLDELDRLGYQMVDLVKSIPGTTNAATSIEETNGEFVLQIDRAKAQVYGVTAMEVASTLRNAISGTNVTSIKDEGDDIDVVVRYELDPFDLDRKLANEVDLNTIESITMLTPSGEIPLSNFVDITFSGNRARISHLDGERIIYVTSGTKEGTTAQEVFAAIQEKIDDWDLPEGYEIKMGGEMEDIEQSFSDMLRAMVLGIFLIAGLLVWQFGSFRQPLFIMVTLPLALIGVFPGLFLVGEPISFPALIGIVALTGIVVNNAIILIDRINYNRSKGMSVHDAVKDAAESRLQPILLTTITTIAGLLPLVISSPTWGPLGYSIIFGLVFSTLLTLVVVPMLFLVFGEKELPM